MPSQIGGPQYMDVAASIFGQSLPIFTDFTSLMKLLSYAEIDIIC